MQNVDTAPLSVAPEDVMMSTTLMFPSFAEYYTLTALPVSHTLRELSQYFCFLFMPFALFI